MTNTGPGVRWRFMLVVAIAVARFSMSCASLASCLPPNSFSICHQHFSSACPGRRLGKIVPSWRFDCCLLGKLCSFDNLMVRKMVLLLNFAGRRILQEGSEVDGKLEKNSVGAAQTPCQAATSGCTKRLLLPASNEPALVTFRRIYSMFTLLLYCHALHLHVVFAVA